ncbi:hypothetical protein QK017_001690 [Campylobacter upsaliensis]|uniref:hypothetical protein n=1 Tax=Campylobacter upsaliensis TaxID=28080 RepID=UPI0012862A75|nr:hypothetical protein [Campylobacter upsaliensis]MPB13733.1 hypothetical protein [Campylobacter jejuni]EAH8209074.1 hypothetical protein [Campylobacter upsaliensis]EAH8338282.1 hypothetical protein [Campylobacter upsaliensis]EAH9285426.1 hypothetical protein [Campylobacter upsaliensis]EAI3339169.1 hypothetical protein [Campylobacter upsaliensis]
MSKLDREKEKIGVLKFWLGIVVATFLAIVGFCVTSYEKISIYLLFLSIFSAIFLLIVALLLTIKIDKKIDRLEDL